MTVTPNEIKHQAVEILSQIWDVNSVKKVAADLTLFADYLDRERTSEIWLRADLTNTKMRKELRLLLQRFDWSAVELGNYFLETAADQKLGLFVASNISQLVEAFSEASKQTAHYQLKLAINLEDADMLEIKRKVEQKFKKPVLFSVEVVPNLIGGFVLIKGAEIIDASVAEALESHRRDWVKQLAISN